MSARRGVPSSYYLAALVASSDDAIVSKDLDGIITSWNNAAERIFGYTAAEAVGRSIRLILPRDRQAEEDEVLARIRRGERIEHFETIRQRKDGSEVIVSLTVSPIRNKTGAIIGASKIARDITEQKRLEAMRADLQRRLDLLVRASGTLLRAPEATAVLPNTIATARELIAADAYAVWRASSGGREWHVVAADGVSEAFAAYPVRPSDPSPLVSAASTLFVPDVAAAPWLAERQEAYAREGIRAMLVVPVMSGDTPGAAVVFYYRTARTPSEQDLHVARALGNLAGAAMRAAELYDSLRRGEETAAFLARAGAVFAGSLDYHVTLQRVAEMAVPRIADWCTVDMTTGAGHIERLAIAHVDQRKIEVVREIQNRYPENPQSPYGVHQVLRTGEPILMEVIPDSLIAAGARNPEHLRLIRELGLVSYMCVPLRTRGRVIGAVTFVAAESGRHYGASDLAFAQEVASRAALAIDNAWTYEEASRANRLKDEFLATLSHELRTPLNAVLGYTRMLRGGMMTAPRMAAALAVLERNASALTQIVEDVLDVSRIVSGKIRLKVQPIDVSRVVSDAVATVQPAAEARGVRLDMQLAPGLAAVAGDADRLQQVAWNLLSNAVKFTPRGGTVRVDVGCDDECIELAVTDTGIGIEPSFLPYVFDRFRQADSGFAREHGGLGLGLAIARHIVEMHGGTIGVSSMGVGHGATFRVRLPALGAGAADNTPSVAGQPVVLAGTVGPAGGKPVGAALAGVSVLAVDDDPDALALLREVLEAAGASVTAVSSAAEALEAATRAVPDVLISDIGMPRIDGFDLISRIRSSPSAAVREIPAAALTAYARSDDRMRALASGFQLHLPKPIDPPELVAAVRGLVARAEREPDGLRLENPEAGMQTG